MKLQVPVHQPMQVSSFQNLNPEYLSGDGASHCEPFSQATDISQKHGMSQGGGNTNNNNNVLHTANGSGSTSDLGKKQQQQTATQQTIKDFFLEDKYVIKEEKPKGHKKNQGCKYSTSLFLKTYAKVVSRRI